MDITIYDHDKDNNLIVKDICFRYTFRENIPCEIYVYDIPEKMLDHLRKIAANELIVGGIMPIKKEIPIKDLKGHYVVLMGDEPAELLSAVSPGFRPSGLLLKPVGREVMEQLLEELSVELNDEKEKEDNFSFQVSSQEYIMPLHKILYFESRNKKIILRTKAQEIEFYDTLDRLSNELGENFIRIHKSFIVNLNNISMIHFSNRTVHFDDGTFIPLSRTCKAALAEEWNRRKGV